MRVGIVGTGYAARSRAEAVRKDEQAKIVAIAGRNPERVSAFAAEFGAAACPDWSSLLHGHQLDLVFVSTINREHAAIARAALDLGIHTVVEYPLALDVAEARSLVQLAAERKVLLHVEHIELISGVHLLLKRELEGLGKLFAVRYITLTATHPAPNRWTYQPHLFGFPLMGAVSRIHRLVDLLGPVERVCCQLRYDGPDLPHRYNSCYCTAQLSFADGLVAVLAYGKGDSLWCSQRLLELHGQRGGLLINGEEAMLLRPGSAHPLETGSRHGLFEQDTRMVLEHLRQGSPLYVNTEKMLHAMAVAAAAEQSAQTQQVVRVDSY
ncbi:MAG: Gfo/Idh/MocA family oxidoreductase [Thermostichus sp. DG02_3_bins_51]